MEPSTRRERERTSRYEEIARSLQEAISHGVYEPGERLPSLRSLARSLSASINTVREAISLLQDRGLVEAQERRGLYVLSTPRPVSEDPDIDDTLFALTGSVEAPTEWESLVRLDRDWMPTDLVPQQLIASALRSEAAAVSPMTLGKATADQTFDLRAFISQRLFHHGATVSPEDIVLTDGALDGLVRILQYAHPRRGVVAIESPTYYPFLKILRHFGWKTYEVPVDENGIRIDILLEGITVHNVTTVLTTPSFHNPTGTVASRERRSELARLAEEYGIVIIEDDVHRETYHESKPPPPIIGSDSSGNVYYCSSFEQVLTPSLKVGWIIARGRGRQLRSEVQRFDFTTSGLAVAILSRIIAAGGFLKHRGRLGHAAARRRLAAIGEIVSSFPPGTSCSRPEGGYSLWVELPKEVRSSQLCAAARSGGIAVAPGTLFSDTGAFDRHIRLNPRRCDTKELGAIRTLGELAYRQLER